VARSGVRANSRQRTANCKAPQSVHSLAGMGAPRAICIVIKTKGLQDLAGWKLLKTLQDRSAGGRAARIYVREGDEKELRAIIRETKVGLVVVGKHGRHGLQRLVMGSVAEQAFREADGLVVTVGPHALPHALLERTTSSKCGTPGKKS